MSYYKDQIKLYNVSKYIVKCLGESNRRDDNDKLKSLLVVLYLFWFCWIAVENMFFEVILFGVKFQLYFFLVVRLWVSYLNFFIFVIG